MKLNAGKRIIMFLHWLCSLLICAALVLMYAKPDLYQSLYDKITGALSAQQLQIIAIAALALYVILVILQLIIIFKRRKKSDRGFIVVDSSESGRVRIAVPAIEQMVRQSVDNIDGISEMRIKIDNSDDAIDIGVNASIVNGGHVPTITMNMQRAIRQFVEMNCGVAVHAVPISIKSVSAPAEDKKRARRKGKDAPVPAAPAPAPVSEEPAPTPAEEETMQVFEPVAEPAAEPVAEPAAEPVAEPVVESAPLSAPEEASAPLIAPWDSAASSWETPASAEESAPAVDDAEDSESAFSREE